MTDNLFVMSGFFMSQLKELEIRCIKGNFESCEFSSAVDHLKSQSNSALIRVFDSIVTHLVTHEYAQILEVSLSDIGLTYRPDEKLFRYEEENESEVISTYVKQLVLLFVGIAALQEFVRANICGPCRKEESTPPARFEHLQFFMGDANVRQYLCKDGEFVMSNVTLPSLLYVSSVLLASTVSKEECSLTRKWWLMRCTMLHQQMLPERIASMYDQMVTLLNDVLLMDWIKEEQYSNHLLLFYMECEQMYLYYQRISPARKFLCSARDLTGLSVELSGAYGKRTQFQKKLVPQLYIQLQRNADKCERLVDQDTSDYPPDLLLQDDTLLNHVSFVDGDEGEIRDLSPDEQIVLFGECSLLRQSGAADELQREEMLSYVNCMLLQRKVWSIYVTTLVLRCKLEKASSRRMDRALRQLEVLIECIKKECPPFRERLSMLYAVSFPTVWSLEKVLADLLMAMGAVKTALDVYKRLDLWEDIVLCYQHLERTASAVEVIEERLKLEQTPLLYCLLGDILDDPKMYEKADEISPVPNARSQRSLGYYHYRRKDYILCIPYFERSVEINYLQSSVWFALGYAALQCEKYDLAAQAYRQVVSLDDDNFQAWNNLSHAYIRSNQKKRAYSSLQEALKHNYEEWRVWENFLLVCVDIGAFEDAIRAYHRLIDIKGKYTDVQVLEILVKAINQNLLDCIGSPSSRLRNSVQKLFGRVTSIVRKEYKIWELYSKLLCPDPDSAADLEMIDKAVGYQQQATVCCSNNDNWPSDITAFQTVLQVCDRNVHLFSSLIKLLEDPKSKAEKKIVCKVMTKRILTRAEHGLLNFQDPEKTQLSELLNSVTDAYDKILES